MDNNTQSNSQSTRGSEDVVKLALKETILDTTVPNEIIMEFISIIEKYNVSTFLVKNNVTDLIKKLVILDGRQDALFDLMVEFRYRLLSHGMGDDIISTIVDSSISIITRSIIANDDYKASLAVVPDNVKKDMFLCMLYLVRVNISYVGDILKIKINKENRK